MVEGWLRSAKMSMRKAALTVARSLAMTDVAEVVEELAGDPSDEGQQAAAIGRWGGCRVATGPPSCSNQC